MKVTERLLTKAVEGTLTTREFKTLDNRASGWRFCAIGENRSLLRRLGFSFDSGFSPQPHHPVLSELGGTFGGLVADKKFKKAFRLYNRIKRIALGQIRVKGGAY